MKKNGFTLVELLIVTVVIVTLMGIVFRLAGVGGTARAKSVTQARLQRLENAISGYYAAYGSYPPVPLEGRSRDINREVDGHGVQGSVGGGGLNSKKIDVACRAQPVAVLFPFFLYDGNSEMKRDADILVEAVVKDHEWSGDYKIKNIGALMQNDATLFQFGLLSFLLPRYLFMLKGASEMYDTRHCQWQRNNQLPCRIDTGRTYESWESMQKALYAGGGAAEASLISLLTSQAVCARWMPNLEGIISGGYEFFGVRTSDSDSPFLNGDKFTGDSDSGSRIRIFSPGGYGSSSSEYMLDGMTVLDGWGREFYYSSDPPYMNYHLWSAGANGRTFPPWLDLNSFSTGEQKTIVEWTKDDISHLSN